MNDRDCLNYDPFAGDRDSNIKLLSDRFVVARYPHQCTICFGAIFKLERHRARTEIDRDDNRAGTFRFCAMCCEAMAKSWKDSGRAIEKRTSIGMERAAIARREAKQLTTCQRPEGE